MSNVITYQENGFIKYWAHKSSAYRASVRYYRAGDPTAWVVAWEHGKGWYLEDLDSLAMVGW
jgi:hypothetical protein